MQIKFFINSAEIKSEPDEAKIVDTHVPDRNEYAMYDFMAKHIGLNLNAVRDKAGKIDESKVTIEKYESLLVFGVGGKLPPQAVKGAKSVRKVLLSLQ